MGFGAILILVLIALVILSILFAVFKFFIGLLPAALIVAVILWLIYKLDKRNNTSNSYPTSNDNFSDTSNSSTGRKPARNVTVKDVKDDDKRGKDNG